MPATERKTVSGTRPAGTSDERSAAAAVREMFGRVAPRYDLLNRVLSMRIDTLWWRRTARAFGEVLSRPGARVLDLCCGTGDMALALDREARRRKGTPLILGVDFAHPMLVRAREKFRGTGITALEADALALPLEDASFDLVTSAFGFRNLANYDKGLAEIHRVLAPGGEAGILDFGTPTGLLAPIYQVYFWHLLPAIGNTISGVKGAYSYLPASVARFPDPEEMLARMRAAGFREVSWTPYMKGIAGLYRGKK
jgi:demethylmenaquinone methyltransferase / 2-methoxy-6-polyprenyl-1,4-benzoquinol methylase